MNINVNEFIPKFEGMETWAQMQEYLAEMRSCVDQINSAKERLEKLKTIINPLIDAFFFEAKSEDLEREAVATLYWGYEYIDASAIRDAAEGTGAFGTSFSKHIYPVSVETFCSDCGAKMEAFAKSRTKLGEYSRGRGFPRCEECQRRREEETAKAFSGWKEREAERQQVIQELRAMPYKEYLQTEHWQALRYDSLKRAGFQCELCASKGELHVHHKTYERHGYEYKKDLIVLCANCHAKFHNKLAEAQL